MNEILTCPFCGNARILEREELVHEPYPDKELKVFRCLQCGREFNERERDLN